MSPFDLRAPDATHLAKMGLCAAFVILCAVINQVVMFVSAHTIIMNYNNSYSNPDHLLDMVFTFPGAYTVACVLITVNSLVFFPLLAAHIDLTVLMKRLMSIFGACFGLKLVVMVATFIGIPKGFDSCIAEYKIKFQNVTLGDVPLSTMMSTSVCGTFMLSLPISWVVLLMLFVYHYMPKERSSLHMAFFASGVLTILFFYMSKMFYTIDVFIGILVAKELFQKYHYVVGMLSLAKSRVQPSLRSLVNQMVTTVYRWHPIYSFIER